MICNLRIEKLILCRFWCPVHHSPPNRNMINDCRMMPYNFLRYEIVEFGNWKKDCSRPFRFQISSCNLHSELYTLLLNQFLRVEDEERILKSSQLPQHTIFVPCDLDFTSCCKLIEMASFTFRSYPHSEILYLYESYTFVGRLPTCSICDIYI